MRTELFVYYAIHFIYTFGDTTYQYTGGNLYSTEEEAQKAIARDWEELEMPGEQLIKADIKRFYPVRPTEEETREAWQSLGDAYEEAMEEING